VASLPNEAEKLNTAAYEIRQAADSVSSLMRDTSAITELKEASAELASHSDELKNSAYLLASGRVPQQPDRMTWFLRGAATAAVVLVVVGILITVLVTRSSGS
jgi:hypothetical protein